MMKGDSRSPARNGGQNGGQKHFFQCNTKWCSSGPKVEVAIRNVSQDVVLGCISRFCPMDSSVTSIDGQRLPWLSSFWERSDRRSDENF